MDQNDVLCQIKYRIETADDRLVRAETTWSYERVRHEKETNNA
jgi:hypothetical protein